MSHPLTPSRRISRVFAKYSWLAGLYAYMGAVYANAALKKLVGLTPTPIDPSLRPPFPARPIPNQSLEDIPYLQFDAESHEWKEVTETNPPQFASPETATNLNVVSYNVLSDPVLDRWVCDYERWTHILEVVLPQLNADVFMLNEVSPIFWNLAKNQSWVQESYYISSYHFNNGPRNNMIISRFPLMNLQRETVNLRRCYIAKVEPKKGLPLWIVCAHLRSQYPGYLIRRAQLNAMYKYISDTCGTDPVLIMGDLNFHNERENVNILPPFYDVWRSLNPVDSEDSSTWTEQQLGITYDVPNNPMVSIMSVAFCERMRLDRALFKPSSYNGACNSETFVPSTMSVVAKDPISPLTPDLVPSDHYALQLIFNISHPANSPFKL